MKTLDLYGLKHEDVRAEVIRFIKDAFPAKEECKIVFGHNLIMWGLTKEVLDEYDASLDSCVDPSDLTFVKVVWK